MGDIEFVIDRLRQKGVSLATIYQRLNVERGYFDGRRRSVNEYKRRELAKQITEAFSEYFNDLNVIEEPKIQTLNTDTYKDEYVQLLKDRIKDLESDRDFLRKIILEKLEGIAACLK